VITQSFVDSCFSLIFNKNTKIRRNNTLYRDILEILDFYKKKEKVSIPMAIKNKVDCLIKVCQMRLNDKDVDNIIDSLSFSEKFKNIIDFIYIKMNEEVKDNILENNVNQVRLRKKLNSMLHNYDKITGFIDVWKDGSYDSMDDVVLNYEQLVREMYLGLMDAGRSTALEASKSLDLFKDDYDDALTRALEKYERKNTTPTGFQIFDNDIFNGGFEASRLYIFAGGSGSGKSTLMLNCIANCTNTILIPEKDKEKKIENVFIYVTLENSVDETLIRLYQMLFNKTVKDAIGDIVKHGKKYIEDQIKEKLLQTKSTLILKYFPGMSISTVDLSMVLDDAILEYGKETIKGLYVDYLDLLKTDVKYDLYRLELGFITLSLKNLAVHYGIPIISATQLNKSAYRTVDSKSLNLDQVSESAKKIEHSDCIFLLIKDSTVDNKVYVKVGKNRSGKSDQSLEFKTNFKYFKFENGFRVTNPDKPDDTSHTTFDKKGGFTGFGTEGF